MTIRERKRIVATILRDLLRSAARILSRNSLAYIERIIYIANINSDVSLTFAISVSMTTKARVFHLEWGEPQKCRMYTTSRLITCVYVFMYLCITRRYILTYKPLTPITLSVRLSKRYGIMIITDGGAFISNSLDNSYERLARVYFFRLIFGYDRDYRIGSHRLSSSISSRFSAFISREREQWKGIYKALH